MNKIVIQAKTRFHLIALLFIVNVIFSACRVSWVATYDSQVAAQIEQTAKDVDRFYLLMLETTNNRDGGRAYSKFAHDYVEIEVELDALLSKNRVRPLNKNSTLICKTVCDLWIKYKNEHKKDNELSDGLIKLNRKYFEDLFFAMQSAENAKEVLKNTN